MTTLDRLAVLGRGAVLTGATMLGPNAFATITAGAAGRAGGVGWGPRRGLDFGYGALTPLPAANEPGGPAYLALPSGFSYTVFGRTGSPMADGSPTPANLGGMAAFPAPGGLVRLIRNHDDRARLRAGSVLGPRGGRYDDLAGGGTTTLDVHPASGSVVRDFVSLGGTLANGGGGAVTVGGVTGWVSGEETTAGPPAWEREHGYNFFVPAHADGPVRPVPLRSMGRFAHRAVVRDDRTGIFYQTEDGGPGRGSGFYRYLPTSADERSGRLQMLAVKAWPRADLRDAQRLFRPLPVEWIDVHDPDPAPVVDSDRPDATSVFAQGSSRGGAAFNRLGGLWDGGTSVFFASTNGGDAKRGVVDGDGYDQGYGQIWEYRPRGAGGQLILVFESPGGDVLDLPDDLLITPQGAILLSDERGPHPLAPGILRASRLIGLDRTGEAFELAVNRHDESGFDGACFSPDAGTLFVNIRGSGAPGSGMTLAIAGPWEDGPI